MKHSAIGKIVAVTDNYSLLSIGRYVNFTKRKLEIAVDNDGVRFCIDDGIWSVPYGTLVALPAEEDIK